ncbi:NAD(P)-dependent oxidoreductase [Rhodococcus rhodnii]|uniref:Uncharacterized protein n=2 Tax=Rhodococcus rhodnii TaxID=38312 RepID=R7WQC5_9NOCA|nr:NAD(P)-binding domain-containing protein [Rhodococcus rhodnii]EOM76189.1 hypothetical protein Rrhod_2555 [Rhodococcus rhodnii LMG 5362]TXG91825.1 NAD(P)-dependent oxidoreductase [Rhodococcus rhodnii]
MSDEINVEPTAAAVIGLGQMGTRLAQAFLAGGYSTTVWNRSPAKAEALAAQGATRAANAGEAVAASSLVVVSLPDYATVRTVLDPVAGQLRGRTLVNLTSGTPHDATAAAAWAAGHGAAYVDGAAMSGTRLVGRPEALFVLSGSRGAFERHRTVLRSLGNSTYLGADPALASVYDTALFGLAWGALAGFYHSLALVRSAGVDPAEFGAVATAHMPFVTSLMTDHARQADEGVFPDDDGTVDVHLAAIEHLSDTSDTQGIGTQVPALFRSLLRQTAAEGHGASGIASVIGAIAKGGRDA